MKFYDFLILEENEFKQKFDSRRYRMIESFAETSTNESEIINFMGKNLNPDFSEAELKELKNLIIRFTNMKEFLNQKTLEEYKTKDELKSSLDSLKNNILSLNINEEFRKIYDDGDNVLIYPESFKSYILFNSAFLGDEIYIKDEIAYLIDKMNGVTIFLLSKNKNSILYKIFYQFTKEITIYDPWSQRLRPSQSVQPSILKSCEEFVNDKFKKYINLFNDPYLKKKYIELNNDVIEKKKFQNREELREQNAWFGKEIGRRALVAFKYVTEYYSDKAKLKDMYDLFIDIHDTDFTVEGMIFRVYDEEEAEREVKEFYETYVNDTDLIDSFSGHFLENFIDEDSLKQYHWEYYSDMIREDFQSYFDEDELSINSYDQRKIDRLKSEKDSLQDEIDNLDMSDEDIESHRERIEEIDLEIEEIEENAEKEPTDEQVDDKIDELWYHDKSDLYGWIKEHGLDIENFIDKESLINSLVNSQGYGAALSTYDDNYDTYYVESKLYYVFRIE